MATTTTPSWTDNTDVIAAIALDAAETPFDVLANASLNLQSKFGAWCFAQIGRTDNTAFTGNPPRFFARRSAAARNSPNGPFERTGNTITAADTTVDATSAADQEILNVTDTTGFVADDLIAIMDPTPGPARLEFHRISKVTNPGAGGELVLDGTLSVEHTAGQADLVTNQADLFQFWIPGGAIYQMGFDYGGASAGSTVIVRAFVQTLDNLGTV